MQRSTWFWILGVGLVIVLACGGFVGLGLWAANTFGDGGNMNLGFGDAIAIVRVEGTIVPGEAPPPNPFIGGSAGGAYSQTIVDHLKDADENDNVKAVVLFVDSPGGSVFASDEIYLQIKAMHKPIITAMGSLAASGGYYISAPTDEIWASPHTFTCSIGVIMQLVNVEQFAEEYGITTVVVKSGQFKDIGNPFREVTDADQAILQSLVDEAYDGFVKIVAEGRDMTEAEVREIADGRVCSGKQAKEMKLVDNLGYLPDVVDRAAELAGLGDEPRIIEYTDNASFVESLSAAFYRPSPIEELRQVLHFNAGSPLMYLYTGQ
ncbi:MAG: signal peptide peptidase SppA [Anaerolineae bacterium]|nr:signal peptide peptidase SppA [Anaerolineae bacterium]